MSKKIGSILKQLRKAKGYTQQQTADRLGITRSTISNYEVGRRTPHLKDLQKLAEMYDAGLEMFGVTQTDEVLDLIVRAKDVFNNDHISNESKEELYQEFMKLYLELKVKNK